MPYVVLEGMAGELTIADTAVGGIRDIAGEEKTIELIPPGKPLANAQAVVGLLDQPARAALLAQSARRRVQQTFSRAGQQQAFHALYAELLASPGPESAEFSTKGVAVQQTPEGSLEESSFPFISILIP